MKMITLRLPDDLADELDRHRGELIKREPWIRQAIKEKLERDRHKVEQERPA